MSRGVRQDLQAGSHALKGGKASSEGSLALGSHLVVALAAATPFGGGLAQAGRDELLGFEPGEGLVDGAQGDLPAGPLLELLMDGDALGRVAEADQGKQDQLFELAETVAHLISPTRSD